MLRSVTVIRISRFFYKNIIPLELNGKKKIDIKYSNNLIILQVITHYKMTDKRTNIKECIRVICK
jgi:hypothetical protein